MQSSKKSTLSMTLVAGAVASALALSVQAAENRAQRYTAGLGGTDMTTMLTPGWYGQVAAIHYHATKLKDANGNRVGTLSGGSVSAAQVGQAAAGALVGTPLAGFAAGAATNVAARVGAAGLQYSTNLDNIRTDAYVLLPRLTYISNQKLLGAHVGFTVMMPIIERQTRINGSNSFVNQTANIAAGYNDTNPAINVGAPTAAAGVNAGIQSNVNSQVAATLAGRSGTRAGHGDLEFAPVFNWEIGDHQTATLTPTIVLPTGRYDAGAPVNPGFGDFYTFRPSFQYGFIGDGWDVGARAIFSFNTRNKDTGYKSGTMFNLDFALMKFVSDDVRLGLQGYVVQQLTDDKSDVATTQAAINAADGAKMRTYAVGPALGWIVNGGEMMVEGKLLKEFGARNRSEGGTYMLMLSKPFGL